MAAPVFLVDSLGQQVPTLVDTAGVTGYPHGSPAIASPGGNATKATSVYLYGDVAGVPTLVELDASGHIIAVGPAASGAAVAGNPLRVAGSDGTNTRDLFTDASGRVVLGLPIGTVVTASATGAAAAIAPALPAVAAKTNYVTGFEVTGGGATAASIIAVTLTGTISGTLSYYIAVPAGVALGITPLIVEFSRPIPASAVNTAITLNVASFGAGNTAEAGALHGFVL